MSEKLIKALEDYENKFKDGFPTVPLLSKYEESEIIDMISKCIAENKDVYDMGYLELDEDIMY